MSHKCNYNKRYDYIRKSLKKGRTVGSEKRRQNYANRDCKNVKSNEF